MRRALVCGAARALTRVVVAANAGIFFEFKHVKPKKGNYVSTRCWAFMEMDELREGKIQLERCVVGLRSTHTL